MDNEGEHVPREQVLSLSAVASKAGELHRVQRSREPLQRARHAAKHALANELALYNNLT